jgi:hypothetical protein
MIMALNLDQLKQIAKDYIKESSPDLAAVEPIHQEEERSVQPTTQTKLGIAQPKKIPSKVSVFTFRKTATTEDGAMIPIVVRVTVDTDGNIVKETGN